MKKILVTGIVLMMVLVNTFSITLSCLDPETKNEVVFFLEDKIELSEGETIQDAEGEKFVITAIVEDVVVIVDDDGNIMIMEKN